MKEARVSDQYSHVLPSSAYPSHLTNYSGFKPPLNSLAARMSDYSFNVVEAILSRAFVACVVRCSHKRPPGLVVAFREFLPLVSATAFGF